MAISLRGAGGRAACCRGRGSQQGGWLLELEGRTVEAREGTHKSSYNIGKRKFLQNASSSTALQEKTAWGFKIPDEVPGPCGISGIYNKCARCVGVKWQLTQTEVFGFIQITN